MRTRKIIIDTPFPTIEDLARTYGMSIRRVRSIQKMVLKHLAPRNGVAEKPTEQSLAHGVRATRKVRVGKKNGTENLRQSSKRPPKRKASMKLHTTRMAQRRAKPTKNQH
jgi:hypothetical protein